MCSRIMLLEWQHSMMDAEMQTMRSAVEGLQGSCAGRSWGNYSREDPPVPVDPETMPGETAPGTALEGGAHAEPGKSAETGAATGPDASQTMEVWAAVTRYAQRKVDEARVTVRLDLASLLHGGSQPLAAAYVGLFKADAQCEEPAHRTKIKEAMCAVRDLLVLHIFVGYQEGSSVSTMMDSVFAEPMPNQRQGNSWSSQLMNSLKKMIGLGSNWGEFCSAISDMGLEDNVREALYDLYGHLGRLPVPKTKKKHGKTGKGKSSVSCQASAGQSVDGTRAARPPHGPSMVASSTDTDTEVQDRASEAGGHVIKYESMHPAKVACRFSTCVCVEATCCLQIAEDRVRIAGKDPVLLVMGSEKGPLSTHHHGQAAQVLQASTFQQAVLASGCDVEASRWGGHYARDVQVLLDSQGNQLEKPYRIAMVYAKVLLSSRHGGAAASAAARARARARTATTMAARTARRAIGSS